MSVLLSVSQHVVYNAVDNLVQVTQSQRHLLHYLLSFWLQLRTHMCVSFYEYLVSIGRRYHCYFRFSFYFLLCSSFVLLLCEPLFSCCFCFSQVWTAGTCTEQVNPQVQTAQCTAPVGQPEAEISSLNLYLLCQSS